MKFLEKLSSFQQKKKEKVNQAKLKNNEL